MAGFVIGVRGGVAAAVTPSSYTSNFAATENPINEGGIWLGGGQSGRPFGNMQTGGGKAYADRLITTSLDDSLMIVDKTKVATTDDHYVILTIYREVGYQPPDSHEIEALLRGSANLTDPYMPLYEVNYPFNDTHVALIKQSGSLPGYSFLTLSTDTPMSRALQTLDQLGAQVIGTTVTVRYRLWNGSSYGAASTTAVCDISQTSYHATGAPGAGAFVRSGTGADPAKCCIQAIEVGAGALPWA